MARMALGSSAPAFVGLPVARTIQNAKPTPKIPAGIAKAGQNTHSYGTISACSLGAVAATALARRSKHVKRSACSPQGGTTVLNKAEKLQVPRFLLDNVDIFIFDCDGVIWRGDSIIPGIPQVIENLKKSGKKLFFVTNNSTKSRAGYQSKFTSLGLNVQPEEIFSSSFAAAAYLEQTKFKDTGKKVYIIGEKGISEELDLVGVPWLGGEGDKDQAPNMGSGGRVDIDPRCGCGDCWLWPAYQLLQAAVCPAVLEWIAWLRVHCHQSSTEWRIWQMHKNGLATALWSEQSQVVLAENQHWLESQLLWWLTTLPRKYGITDRSRICMVGDRLDTDIAFGRNNGLKTCLTLSGVTSEDELLDKVPRKKGTEGIQPEFYVDTICDFYGIRPWVQAPLVMALAALWDFIIWNLGSTAQLMRYREVALQALFSCSLPRHILPAVWYKVP